MQAILWAGFIAFVLVMMLIDLFVVSRKGEAVPVRKALAWTGVCIVAALAFVPLLYLLYSTHAMGIGSGDATKPGVGGREAASIFLQGWLLEYALSVDNLFVFAVIFQHFRVPAEHQHRVLGWGIIAALVLRGVMIGAGTVLLNLFHWLIPLAGVFLIYTGWGMARGQEDEFDAEHHWSAQFVRKFWPLEPRFHGDRFFVTVPDRNDATRSMRAMTPLFLVLVVVNVVDVVFALDSIPAVFGISRNIDAFLVFTSNVFAILGLRSLYFAIAALMGKFDRLKYALAFILAFIGVKMILENGEAIAKAAHSVAARVHADSFTWDGWSVHMPTWLSLVVIVVSLACGVAASIFAGRTPGAPGRNAGGGDPGR
ncbi:MAG: TerC/Alx family metal homeostasis membrane protein [Phycisphaerales bacterium]